MERQCTFSGGTSLLAASKKATREATRRLHNPTGSLVPIKTAPSKGNIGGAVPNDWGTFLAESVAPSTLQVICHPPPDFVVPDQAHSWDCSRHVQHATSESDAMAYFLLSGLVEPLAKIIAVIYKA